MDGNWERIKGSRGRAWFRRIGHASCECHGIKGTLISVEARTEHAEVGKMNMERLSEVLPEFPQWYLIEGDMGKIGESSDGKM